MRILAVDVGTGTQDILLFDTERGVENCIRMVMPSPTVQVAERVRAATRTGTNILLTGVIMGGGPCHWAVEDHIRAGLQVFATPEAAKTFNDVLDEVESMGVSLVSDDEVAPMSNVEHIETRDLHLDAIREALQAFGVAADVDGYAVAVFDHGDSPAGYSDRAFRFDYLREHIGSGLGLSGFAFWGTEIPDRFTRLQAVADTLAKSNTTVPLLVMDTGPAAVLGALEDARIALENPVVIANIGNFHTLAFHLANFNGASKGLLDIAGVFEHHTGELTSDQLVVYLNKLAASEITNEEVFNDKGHGAFVRFKPDQDPTLFAVTGPRRNVVRHTNLPAYLAVPHGDMMLAGCFGLIRAYAAKQPSVAEEIESALAGTKDVTLW